MLFRNIISTTNADSLSSPMVMAPRKIAFGGVSALNMNLNLWYDYFRAVGINYFPCQLIRLHSNSIATSTTQAFQRRGDLSLSELKSSCRQPTCNTFVSQPRGPLYHLTENFIFSKNSKSITLISPPSLQPRITFCISTTSN